MNTGVPFRGVFTAVATPFSADASTVDHVSLARLVRNQLSAGVHGIVACGATGEACALSDQETEAVLETCLAETKGKIPCVLGLFSNSTSHAVEMAKRYSGTGVAGYLIVVPYFNKPTQNGIVAHFSAIRSATEVPIIVYNHPGRTSVNMLPATAATLAKSGAIAGIKEGAGDMVQGMDVIAAVEGRIPILGGEDALFLPMLSCGATGLISASANVLAKEFVDIFVAWEGGDLARARSTQLRILPKIRALFRETNPIPVKTLLALRGEVEHASLRLPLTAGSQALADELRRTFRDSL